MKIAELMEIVKIEADLTIKESGQEEVTRENIEAICIIVDPKILWRIETYVQKTKTT